MEIVECIQHYNINRPMIFEPSFQMEILRRIQVGLLCVQEFAQDRPTVSTVVSILKSEIVDMPHLKKPTFTKRQIIDSTQPSQTKCLLTMLLLQWFKVNS